MESRQPLTHALRPVEDTDVTTWELPEGAIGRLGQGWLLDVEFSPDGAYLTVSTKIGFWIYDTATMAPRALHPQGIWMERLDSGMLKAGNTLRNSLYRTF